MSLPEFSLEEKVAFVTGAGARFTSSRTGGGTMTTHRGRTLVLGIGAALCLAGGLLLPASPGEAGSLPAVGLLQNLFDNVFCGFPATGQTTIYPADKNGNPGAAVPDDGTVEAGKTLNYKDNGDGTITDKVTRLMWEKKSDDGGLHDKDNAYPWSSAVTDTIWDWLDDVNAEGGKGFAHHRDWRIPNVKELQSIIDYENFTPAVASAFNTNCGGNTVFTGSCTAASNYWSSSTNANNPGNAWNVDFNNGNVNNDDKSNPLYVRAVRGGS